ncbi:NADH-quinone oxidoreductase subunit NuoG, partial [Acidithiobacillus caldus]
MPHIEIDGRELDVAAGTTILEAARQLGIYIPVFCYHPKLSIAANCRMCLVDVEKQWKPLPACATPCADGMKIQTRSAKAKAAQQGVLEFLLINHPLDCPVCDQGGECPLQDITMGYANPHSFYQEEKRVVADKDIGPLIATEMTRCIQCTRCVRFGQEIGGIMELGVVGRGEKEAISTYVAKAVSSELSGNMIDLCPVGALTSKPFRYKARSWELKHTPSLCPHCSTGCNTDVQSLGKDVLRVLPRANESVNEEWICDKGRFAYAGLAASDRGQTPLLRVNGSLQPASWAEALEVAAAGLEHLIQKHGPQAIAALISPNSSNEELFLFQALFRALGVAHIEHRLRQTDFRA